MKRRDFIKAVSGAGALSVLTPWEKLALASPQQDQRVNILFLMDDQHRGDSLGATGANWIKTPHLDRLAKEGACFRRAYSSLPSCLPARASLLTGKSPWLHGVLLYTEMATEYEQEKPRLFTQAGYRTHAVGKMHFDSHKHGYETVLLEEAWRGQGNSEFKCDYRKWFMKNYPDKDVDVTGLGYTDHRGKRPFPYSEDLHPTNWTAQQAVDFLDTYQGDRPWFLKVSFKRPHPPFDAPQRFMDEYENRPLPIARVGDWAEKSFGHMVTSPEKIPNLFRGHCSKKDIHQSRAAYYAGITHVDEQIGRVIDALKARGELENTLILFTSDHGDMMGDNHLWRKTYAYEGSSRIPMIIRWPDKLQSFSGIKRGQMFDQLVELRDVLPTFLDAAGMKKPDEMDGMSMLDLIRGNPTSWRQVLDLEHGSCYWKESGWVALTDEQYKYIYFTITGEQQLFDLKNDPDELHERSGEKRYANLLMAWRKRMYDHLAVRGEPWVINGDLAVQEVSLKYGPNHPTVNRQKG